MSASKNKTTPSGNRLIVSSPEFVEDGGIPIKYSCKGAGVNPTLVIDNIPEGTQSMVLIMEDPDAPRGIFTHWVLFDILPANSIVEDSSQGVSGLNSKGETGYTGPCPPSGIHRYFFHIYALSKGLNLRPGSDRSAVEEAMQPLILAAGSLMGRFGDATAAAPTRTAAAPTASAVVEKGNEGGMAAEADKTGNKSADRTTVEEAGAGYWNADTKGDH